jgi:hypothetical protein
MCTNQRMDEECSLFVSTKTSITNLKQPIIVSSLFLFVDMHDIHSTLVVAFPALWLHRKVLCIQVGQKRRERRTTVTN